MRHILTDFYEDSLKRKIRIKNNSSLILNARKSHGFYNSSMFILRDKRHFFSMLLMEQKKVRHGIT